MRTEMKRAAGSRPAAKHTDQVTHYTSTSCTSRADLLQRAAEVLLLLLRHDLSRRERTGFAVLFERRLARVYAGGRA